MRYKFHDWFGCPECDERERVSALAHEAEIVFECHECGAISEFVIGEDLPFQNLNIDAIADRTGEQTPD